MRRSRVRVEPDRHFACTPEKCKAPARRRRLAAGRKTGQCVPRRTIWVRFRVDGKRLSEGYSTQAEAEQRRDQIAAMITLETDPRRPAPPPKAPLFRDIIDKALVWYRGTRTLRPTTLENHDVFAEKHLRPFFGAVPVDEDHVDRAAIRRFIVHLRGSDGKPRILADSSIAVGLPTLGIILDYAVEEKWLPQNPMRAGATLWRREQPVEDVDPFTPEELRAIIPAAYTVDHDFGVLVQIVAQCGLRPGEGLALRRCDIDLARAEVHVRGTYSRSRMGAPKTRSSIRVVSLLDHVVVDEALSRTVLARIKGLKIASMDPEDRMFPLGATGYFTRWRRALAKAGVRHRKLHALRHSFASILLSRGENILRVQKAGGWSSATILLGTYSRWIDEGAKRPPTRDGARSLATSRVNARGR